MVKKIICHGEDEPPMLNRNGKRNLKRNIYIYMQRVLQYRWNRRRFPSDYFGKDLTEHGNNSDSIDIESDTIRILSQSRAQNPRAFNTTSVNNSIFMRK